MSTKVQRKAFQNIRTLWKPCFREFYRVLKTGSLDDPFEFHNSQTSSLELYSRKDFPRDGFVIANVSTLG